MCPTVCHPLPTTFTPSGWFCPDCDQPFPAATGPTRASRRPGDAPIRGRRTYLVRKSLAALGGRWDPAARLWWVPYPRLGDALSLAQYGDDALGHVPPSTGPVLWCCWECGAALTQVPRVPVEPDVVTSEAYWCGCTED